MDSIIVIEIFALILLLALSAFFSSAETAFTTVNKIRMRTMVDDGVPNAARVLKILDQSQKMLSTILIMNNIVNLSAASLTTSVAYEMGGSMIAICTALLTFLIILLGEITPKTLASVHSESLALAYAPIVSALMYILTPIIFVINWLSSKLLLLLHVDASERNDVITESELRTIVDVSHEDGVIETDEKKMIHNVFDLDESKARDVMIPKVHVTFANVESTYDELINIFREDKFTRLPIYESTTDHVIGTINMKDLLLFDDIEGFQVKKILRKPFFTYEYKNVSELLMEMRQAKFNIAIVLDEYGDTAGLITLEDILEEIVGDIQDEYDEEEEANVQKLGPHEFLVEGATHLEELNDRLDLDLHSEDYESVGGLIIEKLDRLPEVGDYVILDDGIRMVVEKLDRKRVERVHIYIPQERPLPEGQELKVI